MEKKNKWDDPFLQNVYEFAQQAHANQVRKGTQIPYVTHLVEAAEIVSSMTDDCELVAAALLHDVVEDTTYSRKDIAQRFGQRVAQLVEDETEEREDNCDKVRSWRRRKEATLAKIAKASREAQMIALGDKLSNARTTKRSMEQVGDQVWERFNQKDKSAHQWYYEGILKALNQVRDTAPYQELQSTVSEIFRQG